MEQQGHGFEIRLGGENKMQVRIFKTSKYE